MFVILKYQIRYFQALLCFFVLTDTHFTGRCLSYRLIPKPRTQITGIHFRFSEKHEFTKPNDIRALELMDHAARKLMEEYPDIVLAFGESDEFRLVLPINSNLLFIFMYCSWFRFITLFYLMKFMYRYRFVDCSASFSLGHLTDYSPRTASSFKNPLLSTIDVNPRSFLL